MNRQIKIVFWAFATIQFAVASAVVMSHYQVNLTVLTCASGFMCGSEIAKYFNELKE